MDNIISDFVEQLKVGRKQSHKNLALYPLLSTYSIGLDYLLLDNEIVNGRRGITPSTALRLAKFFGMSEGFWTNLQLRWDLYHAKCVEENELRTIKPYSTSEVAARI